MKFYGNDMKEKKGILFILFLPLVAFTAIVRTRKNAGNLLYFLMLVVEKRTHCVGKEGKLKKVSHASTHVCTMSVELSSKASSLFSPSFLLACVKRGENVSFSGSIISLTHTHRKRRDDEETSSIYERSAQASRTET